MALARRDDAYHTYADYLGWSEDVRYELIDGVAYLMAPPAPDLNHQEVAGDIYFQLRRSLEDNPCRAFIAPLDVRLPKADEADEQVDTVVQELAGETPVGVLPGVVIAWDALVARLPPVEY